jgi:hypothetical protein
MGTCSLDRSSKTRDRHPTARRTGTGDLRCDPTAFLHHRVLVIGTVQDESGDTDSQKDRTHIDLSVHSQELSGGGRTG